MTRLTVRARAVDMLGRQQIAGIPNALHELFKNAHDAYAERAEVDYFRKNRVLLLRDDGYGMTRSDLEGRWLTLGTESRVQANTDLDSNQWRGIKNLAPRVIMGEKGIGRLAVAVVGPITILMTRAIRPDGLHNMLVALIHWSLFEQPAIDISAIDIPIKEMAAGAVPNNRDILELVEHVRENIGGLKRNIEHTQYRRLIEELLAVEAIDPSKLDSYLNSGREVPLSLAGDGYGTHFIVLPVAPELNDDIDGGADKDASKLERNLLGFSNYMSNEAPVIWTEFRDHQSYDSRSLIGQNSFFTVDDFEGVDQFFEGNFGDDGQFVGTVSIYGKKRQFICNWSEGRGRPAKCGSFYLKYGYVQGVAKESKLSPEEFSAITGKLERIGGLYIYRDNIRILPYGNSDVDWLDIEKRRTKSAGDWYFSYRRGFGYIAVSHKENPTLSEKAGREGFRENLAYRDFRSILINFFQQLAFEFFREKAPQGDDYWGTKQDLALQAKILARQKKKAEGRREEFAAKIDEFYAFYEENFFEEQADHIKSELDERLSEIANVSDIQVFAADLRKLDMQVREQLRGLHSRATVSFPRGLALTNRMEKNWIAYERMAEEVRNSALVPLQNYIDEKLRCAAKDRIDDSQRREDALDHLSKERDSSFRELSNLRRVVLQATDKMKTTLQVTLQEEFSNARVQMELLLGEFARKSALGSTEIDAARNEVEGKLTELMHRDTQLLLSLTRQMEEIKEGIAGRETLDDRFAALEFRNQKLEEQLDFYGEFAQMGMAIGVLQHEFEGAAKGLRKSLAELKPWADSNPSLNTIYANLRVHFEHLDGYLKAVDPLGRRLHRATVILTGEEILDAIRRIFSASFLDHNIKLLVTDSFRVLKVKCKSSTMIGALVNIIDNAIYWINIRGSAERSVQLDAHNGEILIENSGPGIDEHLKEQIFEFGVTEKPGGRGLGLAISRDALRREGFDLKLVQAGKNSPPVFGISENNG
jgi:signal transduction histidine kinase